MIWEPPPRIAAPIAPRTERVRRRTVNGETLAAASQTPGTYWVEGVPRMVFTVMAQHGRKNHYCYFALRFELEGRTRHINLGAYPAVSLAEARKLYSKVNPTVPRTEHGLTELRDSIDALKPPSQRRNPAGYTSHARSSAPAPIGDEADLERLKDTPGYHRISGDARLNLAVRFHPTKRKQVFFEWRYTFDGHALKISIGALATMTLDEARSTAARLVEILKQGIDPREEWERTHPQKIDRRGPDGLTKRERKDALYLMAEESGLLDTLLAGGAASADSGKVNEDG